MKKLVALLVFTAFTLPVVLPAQDDDMSQSFKKRKNKRVKRNKQAPPK